MVQRGPFRFLASDRRLTPLALMVAAWTLVALTAAAQAVALVRLDGGGGLAAAVLARLSIIPLWALATPLILRSARRFPVIESGPRVIHGNVARHLALGGSFIVASNLLIRIPTAVFSTALSDGFDWLVRSTLQGVAEYLPPALVVYGVIVAIGHRWGGVPSSSEATVPARPLPDPTASVLELTAVTGEASVTSRADVPARADAPTVTRARLDGHVAVRQWNRVHLVRVDDIDFVEAEDNYVVVHTASRAYRGRDRISEVESQLDAHRFVRIHRSTIVHVAKIREVQPLTHGDHAVVMRDGRVLRVARTRRRALGQALGIPL